MSTCLHHIRFPIKVCKWYLILNVCNVMGIWCIWQSPVYRVLFEPIKAVFLCFGELYNTMKNGWFLLTWEPSKGLARCRSLICVPCYSTQLDWQIPSLRPGSVLNTIHYGAGLPLLSEPGCGPECSVATLCLFSSPPTLPWGAAEVSDCSRKRLLFPSLLICGQYLLLS